MRKWNPRYVEYARAHGRTPEAMLEADRERNVYMMEFMFWIQARWREWERVTGFPKNAPHFDEDHRAFDRWLAGRPAGEGA